MISDFRRRLIHFRGRRSRGNEPVIHYFHQVDDPYSLMASQKLEALRERYSVEIITHAVSLPAPEYQGDASRFRDWAIRDAQTVASFYGTTLPESFDDIEPEDAALTKKGDALREELGHYLSGTFYFEGEWYWGVDRLFHLENRLISIGFSNDPSSICVPRPEPESATGCNAGAITLEYFPSLRSPYTAISYARTMDLVERSGVTLKLRPVMPMMMRGIAAPRPKQFYIMTDANREAQYYRVPFGNIVDPFGEPVKAAFALLPYMQRIGCDIEFCGNYLNASWAEGIDVTIEKGLRLVVEESGGNWLDAMKAADDWEAVLEDNVQDMLDGGLWGVPSFRVTGGNRDDDFCCWGQDRLWRVETEISRRSK